MVIAASRVSSSMRKEKHKSEVKRKRLSRSWFIHSCCCYRFLALHTAVRNYTNAIRTHSTFPGCCYRLRRMKAQKQASQRKEEGNWRRDKNKRKKEGTGKEKVFLSEYFFPSRLSARVCICGLRPFFSQRKWMKKRTRGSIKTRVNRPLYPYDVAQTSICTPSTGK